MSGTTIVLGGTTKTVVGPAILNGVTIQSPGTLATVGVITLEGALLTGGAAWSNSGTVNFASGYLTGGSFTNNAGAVLNLTGNTAPVYGATTTLSNAGLLESGGSGTTTLSAPFTETGTIAIASGTLNLTGGGSLAGPVTGPGTLELSNGTWKISTNFSHAGTFELISGYAILALGGATTSLAGPLIVTGANIQGPGTLATTGVVTLGGATLSGGAAWSNSGTVNFASGYLTGGSFTNNAGAVLNLTGNTAPVYGATTTLSNAGLLESGGSGTTTLSAPITNTGTILATSGSLDLTGPVSGSGLIQIDAGVVLEAGNIMSGGAIKFLSNSELTVANASQFGSRVGTPSYTGPLIEDFITGDKIDLLNVSPTGVSYQYSPQTGLLQIISGTSNVATLLFQNSSLGSGVFHVGTDGSGHTLITHS
jgi:fibronectin-binding autotransporter adhesin